VYQEYCKILLLTRFTNLKVVITNYGRTKPFNLKLNIQVNSYIETQRNKIVERRMVDRIQVAILLNEKQATVMFPTAKGLGEPDMNSVFYSEDPLFHEWCLDYFRYNWYNSKSFDESKLLEV
jgi:hypothetical protein